MTADGPVALDAAIAQDPKHMLGERVRNLFGDRLPYLLKVLAADHPLSIQAHPNGEQAAAGHFAENAAGIPADAPHRCYRDPHHKPEMLYASEPFEMLVGLRPPAEALELISGLDTPLLEPLRDALAGSGGVRDAVRMLLTLPEQEMSRIVDDAARAIEGVTHWPVGARVLISPGQWITPHSVLAALTLDGSVVMVSDPEADMDRIIETEQVNVTL
jgi:mannose-6-phosphate isomerase